MQEAKKQQAMEYAEHLCEVCKVAVSVLDIQNREFIKSGRANVCRDCDLGKFGKHGKCGQCSSLNTHLYGSNEAFRWNGQYLYYCPLGLLFAASPIADETGRMEASFIAGPMVLGDIQDTVFDLPEKTMEEAVRSLPALSTGETRHFAALLRAAAAFVSGVQRPKQDSVAYEHEKMMNEIHRARDRMLADGGSTGYSIEYEKKLHNLICSHDKSGAQELLNELIGQIYCTCNFDLATIKVRVLELVVVLSRATIDAGADVQEIFLFNTNYISEIDRFDNLDDLSVWLSAIMHRFINYSFDFTQVKHSDIVYKVMEYVKRNYSNKISLDDIAKHVFLSRSYLSSVFKEETGYSLFNYINRVRVEKSKYYLLGNSISLVDVASMCGFEDQSYFTKVFKKATGVSPKKYRDSRGNAAV